MNRSYGWKAEVVEPEIVPQVASKPEVSIGIKLQSYGRYVLVFCVIKSE